jgi:lactoylglutathione lyase
MTTAPLVTTSGINVVYLYVQDLDRSLHFYRDLLGVDLRKHPHNPDWAEVTLPNGLRFALETAHPGREPQTPGSIRVDFQTEDVDAAAERLQGAGVRLGDRMHEFWGDLCEVFDPDGYRIGLFCPPR